jgi:hypothetical protein
MARLTAVMQHWVRWEATTWKERMLFDADKFTRWPRPGGRCE